jgi:hypothetical protein
VLRAGFVLNAAGRGGLGRFGLGGLLLRGCS